MKLEHFEVRIPEGDENEDGYVLLRHNSHYTLNLYNHSRTLCCNASVSMDGNDVGVWRIEANGTIQIERPVHDTGRFTFYRLNTPEGKKAGLSANNDLGLISVRFTPEINQSLVLYMAAPRQAGGTGLSGISDQQFIKAKQIEIDENKSVTIHLRLAGVEDEPRPLFQRETAIPPPIELAPSVAGNLLSPEIEQKIDVRYVRVNLPSIGYTSKYRGWGDIELRDTGIYFTGKRGRPLGQRWLYGGGIFILVFVFAAILRAFAGINLGPLMMIVLIVSLDLLIGREQGDILVLYEHITKLATVSSRNWICIDFNGPKETHPIAFETPRYQWVLEQLTKAGVK